MANFNGTAIAITCTGAVLAYSGIKGKKISGVVRSLIAGETPSASADSGLTISSYNGPRSNDSELDAIPGADGKTPKQSTSAVGGTAAQNKAIMRLIAAPYGWSTGAQWVALDKLVMSESGYNTEARNPSSDAGGIPQALPVSKMSKLAQPKWAGGGGSASAQSKWMLDYVKGRYGDPVTAWAFHLSHNWY